MGNVSMSTRWSTVLRPLCPAFPAHTGKWDCPVATDARLYGESAQDIVRVIRGCAKSNESVLLVGHEPTWQQLGALLLGGAEIRFPTGALIRIDFPVDAWNDIRAGTGMLVWMVTPRQLQQIGWDGDA